MRIRNTFIADVFNRMADLLEIKGDNPFRVRAYRTAARTVYGLTRDVSEMMGNGEDLSRLPGIGKDLANKIKELTETGHLKVLERLKEELPSELVDLMKISGLGGRRIRLLNLKLGILTVEQLEKAANEHKICKISGFGEKTEKNILESIKQVKNTSIRMKLFDAEEVVNRIENHLNKSDIIISKIVAGSFRRKVETVRDIDILITGNDPVSIISHFLLFPEIDKVIVKGESKCTVLLKIGLQVDIRVVDESCYGAALHYFTGSKAHNIEIRKRGVRLGLKINEYGIYRGDKRIGGENESDVYRAVGMSYIEPELREDRGEIDAALNYNLPQLIQNKDIRGDLHVHTNRTDGHASMKEMVYAAMELGYEYVAITDHSKHLAMTHGLNEMDLAKQIDEIDKINSRLKKFRVLKGIEVDILEDGSLDLPDSILKELDLTVCSIHSHLNFNRSQQTERILRAMDNKFFTILAHPTGRLINQRSPYEIDMERIILKAREFGCFIEVNSYPDRLDLNDVHCKMVRDMGEKVAINTDAHSTNDLNFMRLGVSQARRGWLSVSDVINTRKIDELLSLIKRN